MNISSPTYADSALSGYIDYPIKRRIAHIDPRLDSYWKHNLTKLFEELNPQQREDVASQLLESKQIAWDRKNNTFSFTGLSNFTPISNLSISPNFDSLLSV